MSDPSMMWIADAIVAGEIEAPPVTFREALELLQRDYNARCETCRQWDTFLTPAGYGSCYTHELAEFPFDALCPEWEVKP